MELLPGGDGRWPRPGWPLLAEPFRSAWADEPLPAAVLETAGLPAGWGFGDLDARVWERVERARVQRLADGLAEFLQLRLRQRMWRELMGRPLMQGWEGPRVDAAFLGVTGRSARALRRLGAWDDPERLARLSGRQILAERGAGVRTLLDIASALEVRRPLRFVPPQVVSSTTAAIAALGRRFPLTAIPLQDPRFADLRLRGTTLSEGLQQALRARHPDLPGLATRLSALLERLTEQPLDVALPELLEAATTTRNARVLARRLGWDGRGGTTLAEVGAAEGLTRERVRQLEQHVLARLPAAPFLPALDDAIALLEEAAGRYERDGAGLLQSAGLSRDPFLPEGVRRAAELLGRGRPGFAVEPDGRGLHPPGTVHPRASIAEALRVLAPTNHVGRLARVREELPPPLAAVDDACLRQLVESTTAVHWLHDDWLYVEQPAERARLRRLLRRMIAAAGRVRLTELAAGLVRHPHTSPEPLPEPVVAALCRVADLRVEGGRVWSPEPIPLGEALTPPEVPLVHALRECGGTATFGELRDAGRRAGFDDGHLSMVIATSVVLRRLGRGAYALRGIIPTPEAVRRLEEATGRIPELIGSGEGRDGVWMAYELSDRIREAGAVALPLAATVQLAPAALELLAADGTRVALLEVSEDGRARGLADLLERVPGDGGTDTLVLACDASRHAAVGLLGSDRAVEHYRQDRGVWPRDLDAVRGALRATG